jgi:hypothetical protein
MKKKGSEQFISENTIKYPNDSKIPVWRYMSFGKFMDLLSSQSLFFSRADMFVDKFEGYVNEAAEARISQEFSEFVNAEEMRSELRLLLTKLKELTIINCWNMGYSDNITMWDTYCPGNEGVAIKSTIERLKGALWKFDEDRVNIRSVEYIDIENIKKYNLNGIELFTFKRPQFSYENEIRIIIMAIGEKESLSFDFNKNKQKKINPPMAGVYVPIDFKILVDQIYVSPNATIWFENLVKRLVGLMYDKKIIRSQVGKGNI